MDYISKAWKYEIFPTESQRQQINQTIGCCRWVWNWALRIKSASPRLSWGRISEALTIVCSHPDLAWLREPANQPLRAELQHLQKAFARFFDGIAKGKFNPGKSRKWCKSDGGTWTYQPEGYPRLKGRFGPKQSFSQQQNTLGTQNRLVDIPGEPGWALLTIPKLKNVRVRLHGPYEGSLQTVTISRTPTGRYFVSIVTRIPGELPEPSPVDEATTVGVDLGLRCLAATSNGHREPNPRNLAKSLGRLKALQRRLSRKRLKNPDWKESKAYQELRAKIARLHELVANRRNDGLHKATTKIISHEDTQTVGVEDLNVKGLIRNRKLARHIGDAGWGEFKRQLEYKAKYRGKRVHRINRWCPSSQICHVCEHQNKELGSEEWWTCPSCGTRHNRDDNAAQNIKQATLRELSSDSRPGGPTLNKASRSSGGSLVNQESLGTAPQKCGEEVHELRSEEPVSMPFEPMAASAELVNENPAPARVQQLTLWPDVATDDPGKVAKGKPRKRHPLAKRDAPPASDCG